MASESPKKTLSRRHFLKVGAAASTVAATLPATAAATASAATNKFIHYAMVIDTRRCIGCHACSVACKTEFEVPLGESRSYVEYVEKGTYPNVRRSFLPRLCNHCDEPECAAVCPTGATYKRDDGIVDIDKDVCIGCSYCIQACPYGARFLNKETGTADKCSFCLHRVSQGLVPSCVNTCQGRARIFGDINDPDSEISRVLATNSVTSLRTAMGTKPNVFYIGADHTDAEVAERYNSYVRIDTHRRQKERV